jgi:hypothetical protein
MNIKDWDRKQLEKQKQKVMQPVEVKSREEKPMGIPLGYYPGKPVTLEEAQMIERYKLKHGGTGDSLGEHWVNARTGEPVAFSY